MAADYYCEKCGKTMNENQFYTYKDGRKTELCKKCLTEIPMSKVKIINNKLICPYCNHTIETNKFKVESIKKLLEAQKDKEE